MQGENQSYFITNVLADLHYVFFVIDRAATHEGKSLFKNHHDADVQKYLNKNDLCL